MKFPKFLIYLNDTSTTLLNYLSFIKFLKGIFAVPQNNISDQYFTEITPAGVTFSTWGLIFAWQALWLILSIVTIFKKTEDGYMYQKLLILTPVFHILIFLNFVSIIAWLFVWAAAQMSVSLNIFIVLHQYKFKDDLQNFLRPH